MKKNIGKALIGIGGSFAGVGLVVMFIQALLYLSSYGLILQGSTPISLPELVVWTAYGAMMAGCAILIAGIILTVLPKNKKAIT